MSRKPRVHVPGPLQSGTDIHLPKASSHHVLDVLRLKPGSELELFNGDGHHYAATLISGDRSACVRLADARLADNESPLGICLWQAVSRAERMDASVRQAVELGAVAVQPIMSRRCQVKLDDKRAARRHAHWASIIISASEQSGRATVPTLAPLQSLAQALEQRNSGNQGIVLSPQGSQTLGGYSPVPTPEHLDLLIGPESGLTHEEVDQATRAGFVELAAGARILRTETAGPAAIAILQSRFGDLS